MAIKAGVGVSDNPKGIDAIKEALKKSLEDISNPKFSIIFTSIHYEKELKTMLSTAKKILPDTEMIGCTGAAILVPSGVYTRGVGILSVSGDIDIGVGLGQNSRLEPVKAGNAAMNDALKSLQKSKYKKKYAILFVSGMKFPNIPGMKAMMKMSITKKMFGPICNLMAKMGTGPARYEEVLEGAFENNKKIPIVGAGSFDDFKGVKNFQFLNEGVYTDSVVALVIASNKKINIAFKHGLKPTGKKMKITNAKGSLAFEINNKPAWQGFKEVYGIPDELEDKWKNNPVGMTIYEVPAEKDKNNNYWIIAPLCVVGDAILFAKNVEEKTLYICRGSGKEILDAAKDVANRATKNINPAFALIFSPVPRIMAMMEKIDVERRYIKEYLKNKPFLGFYCCASEVALPARGKLKRNFLKCLNETITMVTFGS